MGWGGWAAEGQVGVGENERDSVAEDLEGVGVGLFLLFCSVWCGASACGGDWPPRSSFAFGRAWLCF